MTMAGAARVRAMMAHLRGPMIVVIGYLALRFCFDRVTEQGGLLSPTGDVSLGVAALGVVVIVLRLAVLFVVPAVIAYRLITRW